MDAAASEFKTMSEDCAPQPNFHAYIDAALFYQNVDVKIAEQFFEKALNAGGHANGHCLALMSILPQFRKRRREIDSLGEKCSAL